MIYDSFSTVLDEFPHPRVRKPKKSNLSPAELQWNPHPLTLVCTMFIVFHTDSL